jgi:WD40 repeat protein
VGIINITCLKILEKIKYHITLSNYFAVKPLYLDDPTQKTPNTRKLVEQPWQQTKAERWNEAAETLCDLWFMDAKVRNGLVYELQEDYSFILNELPENIEERKRKEEYGKRMEKYIENLTAYSRGDIPELDIIESIKPRTSDKKKVNNGNEENDINLKNLKLFSAFVNSESHNFIRFGIIPHFLIQQANNFTDKGLIFDISEKCSEQIQSGTLILDINSWKNKISSSNPLKRTIRGHIKNSISITADGGIAISGAQKGNIGMWDLKNGSQIASLHSESSVICTAVTPDCKVAVSGGGDGYIRIWDIEKLSLISEFQGHPGKWNSDITDIDITPDGRYVISCGRDEKVKVWDLIDNHEKASFEGISNNTIKPACVAISADGKRAVTGYGEGVIIWDIENQRKVKELNDITNIEHIKMIPTGEFAVSINYKGIIGIWDINSGNLKSSLDCCCRVSSFTITHDGGIAVVGAKESTEAGKKGHPVMVWNLVSSSLICSFQACSTGLSITPDGKIMVSYCGLSKFDNDFDHIMDGMTQSIEVWDLEECIELPDISVKDNQHNDRVTGIAISPDAELAASCSYDELIKLWEIGNRKLITTFPTNQKFASNLRAFNNFTKLISSGNDGTVKFWDIKNSSEITELKTNKTPISCILITPDNKIAVTGSYGTGIIILDLVEYKVRHILQDYYRYDKISISIDGRTLISGSSNDGIVSVWDIESALKIHEFFTNPVSCIVISPDGRNFITGSCLLNENLIGIWDLERFELRAELKAHKGYIRSISFSPDGKVALSAGEDTVLRLWDISDLGLKAELTGHEGEVTSTLITPDGNYAVSGSYDGTIRVWDMETFECVAAYPAKDGITSLSSCKQSNIIMYGGIAGKLGAIRIKYIKRGIPVVTIHRLWKFGDTGKAGESDKQYSALCYWCDRRFYFNEDILDLIKRQKNDPLLMACPLCDEKLRLNPFIAGRDY